MAGGNTDRATFVRGDQMTRTDSVLGGQVIRERLELGVGYADVVVDADRRELVEKRSDLDGSRLFLASLGVHACGTRLRC